MRTEDPGELGRGSFCSIGVVGTLANATPPHHATRHVSPRYTPLLGTPLQPTTLHPLGSAPRRRRTWAHVT